MSSILSNAPSQMGGNPPYWQRVLPLNVQWDFSTPNETYLMYITQESQNIYLNVKKMTGKPMRMHWYNPRTGEPLKIGVAEVREKFGVTPPSEEDWVLVFNDNDLTLPVPGSTKK